MELKNGLSHILQVLLNSYWTRLNSLCKILGVREKILDEASAEFNIVFP